MSAPPYPVGFVPSVKSKLRTAPFVVKDSVPVPPVILNEMLLASVTAPGVIVLEVALESVQITSGVPVTVVVVDPAKIVPVPRTVMLPVPNARAFVCVVLVLNKTVLSVLLLRFSVPAITLNVPVTLGATIGLRSSVVLVVKLTPPPGEFTVIWLKRIVSPALFNA